MNFCREIVSFWRIWSLVEVIKVCLQINYHVICKVRNTVQAYIYTYVLTYKWLERFDRYLCFCQQIHENKESYSVSSGSGSLSLKRSTDLKLKYLRTDEVKTKAMVKGIKMFESILINFLLVEILHTLKQLNRFDTPNKMEESLNSTNVLGNKIDR